jgi:hypothetical protein
MGSLNEAANHSHLGTLSIIVAIFSDKQMGGWGK